MLRKNKDRLTNTKIDGTVETRCGILPSPIEGEFEKGLCTLGSGDALQPLILFLVSQCIIFIIFFKVGNLQ